MDKMFSIVIILLMLNLNLILSGKIKEIDEKVIKNLEHQVYVDEENEIFNLSEDLSVQEYVKNMTTITVSNNGFNEHSKGLVQIIQEIIKKLINGIRNPKWVN